MAPLNKAIPLLALLCLPLSLIAQIKKTISGNANSQTTTIIKGEQSSDLDILSTLDADEFGMHQVVRITTENQTNSNHSLAQVSNVISSPSYTKKVESSPIQKERSSYNNQVTTIPRKKYYNHRKVYHKSSSSERITKPRITSSVAKEHIIRIPPREGYRLEAPSKRKMKNPRFKSKKRRKRRAINVCPKI